VVVIGPVGRNFAAGMSGGVAYVLDEKGAFPGLCNQEMVDLEPLESEEDIDHVRRLIEAHVQHTGSDRGEYVLDHWSELQGSFVKVMPVDYRRALQEMAAREAQLAEAAGTAASAPA
jgi:glutamate synthase domain-containing protein 3